MSVQQGVISNVAAKPWTDKESGDQITLYSFQLEGSNRWFRTGTNPVPFGKGTPVEFNLNGQKVSVDSMRQVEGQTVQAPTPSRNAASAGTGNGAASVTRSVSRDEYWANKEARDLEKDERYQNVDIPRMTMSTAVQSASAVVNAAISQDALSFGNMAKSKRLDALAEFVEDLADRFYDKIVSAPTRQSGAQGEASTSNLDEDE